MASSGVRFETAAITSASDVKSLLNPTRKIKIMALKIILMKTLVLVTTTTENFATLGCAAPSSLLTLTLQRVCKQEMNILMQTIGICYAKYFTNLAAAARPSINVMSQFR